VKVDWSCNLACTGAEMSPSARALYPTQASGHSGAQAWPPHRLAHPLFLCSQDLACWWQTTHAWIICFVRQGRNIEQCSKEDSRHCSLRTWHSSFPENRSCA